MSLHRAGNTYLFRNAKRLKQQPLIGARLAHTSLALDQFVEFFYLGPEAGLQSRLCALAGLARIKFGTVKGGGVSGMRRVGDCDRNKEKDPHLVSPTWLIRRRMSADRVFSQRPELENRSSDRHLHSEVRFRIDDLRATIHWYSRVGRSRRDGKFDALTKRFGAGERQAPSGAEPTRDPAESRPRQKPTPLGLIGASGCGRSRRNLKMRIRH